MNFSWHKHFTLCHEGLDLPQLFKTFSQSSQCKSIVLDNPFKTGSVIKAPLWVPANSSHLRPASSSAITYFYPFVRESSDGAPQVRCKKVRIIDLLLNVQAVLHRELKSTSTGFLLSTSQSIQYLCIILRWWQEHLHTFLQVDREAIVKPAAHYILLQLKSMVVLNFVYKTAIIF